jgi:hypothetical protein
LVYKDKFNALTVDMKFHLKWTVIFDFYPGTCCVA